MAARKKSGFTLIELLVVIAIIAILAAILFPVFARAREAARKSTCQSNMKECAIALQTYWTDYDAMLPCSVPAGSTVGTGTPPAAGNSAGFPLFAAGLGILPPGRIGDTRPAPATWAQMLYNSMKTKDIMFCPSDSADHSPPDDKAYDLGTTRVSYWWKMALDVAWRHGGIKAQKEGDFGYNADQVVFYEHAGFHSGASAGIKNDVQITCAYLDSHVKSISVVNSTAAAGSATYISDPSANGEPNYFNFDNNTPKNTDPGKGALNPPAPQTPVLPGLTFSTTTGYQYLEPSRYSDVLP